MTSLGTIWHSRRGRLPLVNDTALALVLSVLVMLELSASDRPWHDAGLSPLLMTLPLAWRRRQPLLVFVLVVVGAVVAITVTPIIGLAAVMVAAYSVGAFSANGYVALSVILATATIIVTVFHGGLPPIPQWSGAYVILVPLWLVGRSLRTWRLRADASEDRATRLEREQERATRLALTVERARIARELHDVVAHSVSVMVVQAGAARLVVRTSPEQATEALSAVETVGREAMAELRRLLGLLGQDDDGAALAPQPGIDGLEALIRRVADAGLPVEVRMTGRRRPLAPGIDLTAYRIVQEALTNALKHSGLARTQVILDYRESDLKIEVLDEGDPSPVREDEAPAERRDGSAGHGLVGMRERVALFGGTLEAGPRLGRGYAVRAWLPLGSEGAYP